MRKSKFLIAIGLFICLAAIIVIFQVLKSDTEPVATANNQKPVVESHVKYFGYYHTDGFQSSDYIDEIGELGNSNIAMINGSYNVDTLKTMLAKCRKYKMEAYVNIYDVFFECKTGAIGMSSMHNDWEVRWETFAKGIADNCDDIIGFYFDEPYWNGAKEEDFIKTTKMIRLAYPDKRILVCATAKEIDAGHPANEVSPQYYQYVTDATYDLYSRWDEYDRTRLNEKLKSKLNNGQKIWLIAWGFAQGNYRSTETLCDSLEKSYDFALKEKDCEGILVFSYASGDAGDWGSGMDRFFDKDNKLFDPQLKNVHIDIGKKITGKQP